MKNLKGLFHPELEKPWGLASGGSDLEWIRETKGPEMCTVTQETLLQTFTSSGKGELEIKGNVHRDIILPTKQNCGFIYLLMWIISALPPSFPASCSNLSYAHSCCFNQLICVSLESICAQLSECQTSTVPHNKPHTQQLHTNNTTRWSAWLWGRICPTADQLLWVDIHISNQELNIFLQ